MTILWIMTMAIGGAISAIGGIVARKLWKKTTHTEAKVDDLHRQLQGDPPTGKQL